VDGSEFQPAERRGEHPMAGRLATSPREQQLGVSMTVRFVKHTERGAAQRYAMFTACFHPIGTDGPYSILVVDLRSGSKPDFGGSGGGEC